MYVFWRLSTLGKKNAAVFKLNAVQRKRVDAKNAEAAYSEKRLILGRGYSEKRLILERGYSRKVKGAMAYI